MGKGIAGRRTSAKNSYLNRLVFTRENFFRIRRYQIGTRVHVHVAFRRFSYTFASKALKFYPLKQTSALP